MGNGDAVEIDARPPRDVRLDGGIVQIVVFDAGSRFDLDHSPRALLGIPHRNHHISKGDRIVSRKAGLENRCV